MSLRFFGAVLIVFGCGGFGAMLARNDRLAEQSLRSLCAGLDLMSSELQYRLTPLPDLCRMAGEELGGGVGAVFSALAMALEDQISPDVNACMHAALAKTQICRRPPLPVSEFWGQAWAGSTWRASFVAWIGPGPSAGSVWRNWPPDGTSAAGTTRP